MDRPDHTRRPRAHRAYRAAGTIAGRPGWFLVTLAVLAGLAAFGWAASPARAVPPPSSSTTTTVFTLQGAAKAQVEDLTAQAAAVQAEIAGLDERLDLKALEYDRCLGDLDAANERMSELRRTAAKAQADKAQCQANLARRIKSVYMSGGRDQLLQLLLLADGLQDLYNRARLVSTLAAQDKRLISDLKESSDRLDLLLQAVEDEKRDAVTLRRRLSEQAAEIQAMVTAREQTLAGIDQRVKVIVEQERQRQREEQERLQRELEAQLAAAAAAMSYTGGPEGRNVLTPVQIALVAQRAGFSGRDLVIAVAVALAESHGNANAIGDRTIGGSFGLWQIYCRAHPYLIPPDDPNSVPWYDPYQNALWAYRLSGGHNWLPWSTYIHGTYESHMATAQAAVDLITNSSSSATALPSESTTTSTTVPITTTTTAITAAP